MIRIIAILVGLTASTTVAQRIVLVAVAVAVPFWDVSASALVNLARTIAHATCVKGADTVIDVITNAVHVGIHTRTTAHATCVQVQT